MKNRMLMVAITLVAAASSPLMATPFTIIDGGALGSDITYNSARDATYALGQTQAGESCVEMDLTADDAYLRFTGGAGIEWTTTESLLTIEMLVTAQTPLTPDQGLTRMSIRMYDGSNNIDVNFRGFDWFPTTANTWQTFTADLSTDPNVSNWGNLVEGTDYVPTRIFFYNDDQFSGTTFYIKSATLTTPTPEPTMMGLLCMGGLAILRRRKA